MKNTSKKTTNRSERRTKRNGIDKLMEQIFAVSIFSSKKLVVRYILFVESTLIAFRGMNRVLKN